MKIYTIIGGVNGTGKKQPYRCFENTDNGLGHHHCCRQDHGPERWECNAGLQNCLGAYSGVLG